MKNIYATIAILLFFSFSSKSQVIDREDFEKSRQEILLNLKALEEEVITHLRRNDDKENAYFHIDEIKRIVFELSRPAVYPMADDKFTLLLEAVNNEHFDNDKEKIISLSANGNYFLMSQLVLLIQKFTFDHGKLDVVEKIYPKVLDPENNSQLFKHFTFTSSKDKLQEIIKRYQSNPEKK